ncbi:MAG: DUF899 family protein [Gammaproteobacteria bacterium]|nr:DUF899 family protein [Gammaproteobacteria bacterium]
MQNEIVSREAWLAARRQLLVKEKAHTREREQLAKLRQELPWIKIDKDYVFTGPTGEISLPELFLDRSQLAIYHFMFGPDWETPCTGCTSWANAFNGTTYLFKQADARLVAVSRAPYEKLAAQQEKFGWNFTWVSSFDSDFNFDFFASSVDLSEGSTRTVDDEGGESVSFDRGENQGVSIFFKNTDEQIFHTYSTYNRGIEDLNGAFGYFDLLPKGRAW